MENKVELTKDGVKISFALGTVVTLSHHMAALLAVDITKAMVGFTAMVKRNRS
jgi:hypothetical protein